MFSNQTNVGGGGVSDVMILWVKSRNVWEPLVPEVTLSLLELSVTFYREIIKIGPPQNIFTQFQFQFYDCWTFHHKMFQ